jgi:hypothetical protein
MINLEKYKIWFKENTFVKCRRNGIKRFVTKMNEHTFEDDGKISGQQPSRCCHYQNYAPIEIIQPKTLK